MTTFPKDGLPGVSPRDLAWLTGSWEGLHGQDPIEEHWSPLGGNTLMGMFRWVKGGRVSFYELIAIEQQGEFVFLRIKHFHPGLVGWEERDRAAEFLLVRLQDREAVFLELHTTIPRWAIYRLEAEDRLVSYFARDDGSPTEDGLFTYSRQ